MKNFSAAFIIVGVGVFLPFEGYISHLAGAEGLLAIAIKLAPEFIIVFTLAAALLLPRKVRIRRSPIDRYFLILIVIASFSTLIYADSISASLNNFRALFRYVALYYLIYYFGFSIRLWRRLVFFMTVVVAINVALSMAQFGLGSTYPEELKISQRVRVSIENMYEVQKIATDEKIGAVQGLFESPGIFGVFLIVALVFVLSRACLPQGRRRFGSIGLVAFTLITVFFTYSKTAFLLAILAMVVFWYQYSTKWRTPLKIGAALAIFGGFVIFSFLSTVVEQRFAKREEVSALANIENLVSAQYWEHFFRAERGWVIKEVGGELFSMLPLIGYSADEDSAKAMIASSSDGRLARLIDYGPFEDVYWIALLAYFGVAGLGMLFAMLFALYREGKFLLEHSRECGDSESTVLAAGFLTLLLMTVPYCFFERILEINIFSYYFWLFAGMVSRQAALLRREYSCLHGART